MTEAKNKCEDKNGADSKIRVPESSDDSDITKSWQGNIAQGMLSANTRENARADLVYVKLSKTIYPAPAAEILWW